MFQIDAMTEMTEKEASEVTGGLIIVVCIVKSDAMVPETAKVSMQDFHFVM